MGLLKGNWTFTRYRVLGSLPEQFSNFIDEGLKKHAFPGLPDRIREKQLGWTSLDNVLDSDFSFAKYKCGDYLIFSLRIDRTLIPPSLLKLKYMEEEKKYLAETGKKRLFRQEQEELKDRIRQVLMEKALPVPSFYEICWSLSRNTVMFGSHSEKISEDFLKHFKESFQLTLFPFLPWNMDPEPLSEGRSKTVAGHIDRRETSPQKADEAASSLFLGREFLTWLWFKSEERNGTIAHPQLGEIEILFLQRLVLSSGESEYSEKVICQGLYADMKEGKEALRQGKKISEARLTLSKDAMKWDFTFKADMFQFQSLRMPTFAEIEVDADREGRNLERIYLIEKAMDTMDGLFSYFCQLRSSACWEKEEIPRMLKWLNQPGI